MAARLRYVRVVIRREPMIPAASIAATSSVVRADENEVSIGGTGMNAASATEVSCS